MVESRFWARVNKTESCWLWTGGVTASGYATTRLADGKKQQVVHRFAYERLVGLIPSGLELDHLCRVRICVNPAHLEPVTARTNTLRAPEGVTAKKARQTHCIRGHEFDAANTYYRRRGGRTCRKCQAANYRRWMDA